MKWLREWSNFILDEKWYVCICMLHFNMEQMVKRYISLVRAIHGQTARTKSAPLVPIRSEAPAAVALDANVDFHPESSEDEAEPEEEPATVVLAPILTRVWPRPADSNECWRSLVRLTRTRTRSYCLCVWLVLAVEHRQLDANAQCTHLHIHENDAWEPGWNRPSPDAPTRSAYYFCWRASVLLGMSVWLLAGEGGECGNAPVALPQHLSPHFLGVVEPIVGGRR